MITNNQARKLMKYLQEQKTLEVAAAKSGMDEKTARNHLHMNNIFWSWLKENVKKEHINALPAICGNRSCLLKKIQKFLTGNVYRPRSIVWLLLRRKLVTIRLPKWMISQIKNKGEIGYLIEYQLAKKDFLDLQDDYEIGS